MFNLDTVGRGAPGTEALFVNGVPQLVPFLTDVGVRMGYHLPVRDRFTASSDHFPFAMNGVPSGGMTTTELASAATMGLVGRGWGHTPADTVDKANPKSLQSASMVAARVLLRIAESDEWPARRRPPAEVKQQLAAAGMLADLERAGRWPPPR
jgi:Zn-dependent M28 family amino/carboxypeptidase